MNKIELLDIRRNKVLSKSGEIRKKISLVTDENSFVELMGYSFSKNDFYDEEVVGEGVVTGYATIDGSPVYIIAQDVSALYGGVSLSNCKKISSCQKKAEEACIPVIYLLDSYGVQVGEGVNVLEGIAEVLSNSANLKGVAPQISVVLGKLYGSLSVLAANSDVCYFVKGAEVCYTSPLVISASKKNASIEKVAGKENSAFSNLVSDEVEDVSELKGKIAEFLSVLNCEKESSDDFNRTSEDLNENVTVKGLVSAVFDDGKFSEISSSFAPDVKVGLGSVGNCSVASVIFDGGENGVELGVNEIKKVKDFASFASDNALPLVVFVNTLGLKADYETNSSTALKEICELIKSLKNCRRISVMYGKAIGLGYTLFASKSLGTEYSYAFATAKIALFDGDASSVAFGKVSEEKLGEFKKTYSEENADPINAAKNGYVDNIIEPAFVRPYLISALEMMNF